MCACSYILLLGASKPVFSVHLILKFVSAVLCNKNRHSVRTENEHFVVYLSMLSVLCAV